MPPPASQEPDYPPPNVNDGNDPFGAPPPMGGLSPGQIEPEYDMNYGAGMANQFADPNQPQPPSENFEGGYNSPPPPPPIQMPDED
jgi:hypothetical protein